MGLTHFKRTIPEQAGCHYCKCIFPREHLNVDHKVPRSKGGPNTDDNLVIACILCNILKSDMDYDEFVFRRRIRFVGLDELEQAARGKSVGSYEVVKLQSKWCLFQYKILYP
jgi:5-methylcytosine-specific restriction endonuclease McrA